MRMSIADAAMATAWIWSNRGTCPKKKVGACITTADGRVIATGYNGSPAGEPHCTDHGCILDSWGKCTRAVHAETNALNLAGDKAVGATLYSTHFPCESCAKLAADAGVTKIVYEVDRAPDRRRDLTTRLLHKANIALVRHMQEDSEW